MINYQKPVIVIAGPTASGKSSIALEIAKSINGYIINADSRQIYKELKIGTAQPIPDKTKGNIWYIDGIKHYLYGHVSVKDRYNLYQYQKDVQEVLDVEDCIPILVGGTGLYIDSIVYNYDLKPHSKNHNRKDLEKLNVKELHYLIDPDTLNKLNNSDRNNPIRLIRTIERGGINRNKGKSLNYLYLLLDPNTEDLKTRITQRIERMFKYGLLEENIKLLKEGFTYKLPALQSIGYQEFEGYFNKEKSLKKVKDDITTHTLQYAKRQRTWFKRNTNIVRVDNYKDCYEEVSNFLTIS